MEVENQPPGVEETQEKMEMSGTEEQISTKEEEIKPEETEGESPKKNGTITAPTGGNTGHVHPYGRREERVHTSGIIVQFPEMFSLKRDRHIIDKFSNALDVRMQKCAFIECDSEESAAAVLAKVHGTVMNNKKVMGSRLDMSEKISLYTSNLKKETTDEYIKENYPGVEEILREKFSVFIKFSSETESRAARAKIIKEGINGQKVHCDFDHKKERFNRPEPPAKKQKLDDGEEDKSEEVKEEDKEEEEQQEEQGKVEEEVDHTADVKADEW